LAKTFEINLVLIINDYFKCAINKVSLNCNGKLLTVKLFANRSDNFVQVE